MRSDNTKHTMKLNRFLGSWFMVLTLCLLIDFVLLCSIAYFLNLLAVLPAMVKNGAEGVFAYDYLAASNFFPHFGSYPWSLRVFYFIALLFLAAGNVVKGYALRVSYADKEVNYGQKGTRRWTTTEEKKAQYRAIPLKDDFYHGESGTIISRIGDKLYIDSGGSNQLIIGTTRSGKGEMYVVPSMDVISRTLRTQDRKSMIITDPKPELYKMAKDILEARGYEVIFVNLADPLHSAGYNPLYLVIEYYKKGEVDKAKMAARSFAYAIFNADPMQEMIWKNTATDLFTALIVAVTSDCLEEDKLLNEKRRKAWIEKRQAWRALSKEEQEEAAMHYRMIYEQEVFAIKSKYHELSEEGVTYKKSVMEKEIEEIDMFLKGNVFYIADDTAYTEIHPNEKKVNCYSCLNFFRELADTKALESAGSDAEREKIAETALDEYFNHRPPLDYAKSLYQEIKGTGDRTKGSVYINMQSALSIFSLDSIAMLTAENDIDIEKIGYGDKPVALFIGIPSQDKSNHFLATTLITQIYQYLFNLTSIRKEAIGMQGKLKRKVKFILDEFGNLPPIEEFPSFVTVGLGLGISFDIYVQALAQLEEKYKDSYNTIMENMANQIYIKSISNETAKTFSEALGNTTVIEIQRSGSRFSTNKHFTETPIERPLMYPQELQELKEGECVILRGMDRKDKLGVDIKSYPIINEVAEELTGFEKLEVFISSAYHVFAKKKPEYIRLEKRNATFWEDFKIRRNQKLREKGSQLFYRYQYLSAAFKNPDEIFIEDINNECREHLDYTKMVYDPQEAIESLEEERKNTTALQLKNAQNRHEIIMLLVKADKDWRRKFDITEKDTISRITDVLTHTEIVASLKAEIMQALEKAA